MSINKELLDIIACPKCKTKLILNNLETELECNNCQLAYLIENDIPVLLEGKAIPLKK